MDQKLTSFHKENNVRASTAQESPKNLIDWHSQEKVSMYMKSSANASNERFYQEKVEDGKENCSSQYQKQMKGQEKLFQSASLEQD
ncbi:conserved hypothetical protein [Ricinus communis]|uniref:Uncharacterized protein n=1 Tax=Ricinus communis TaxID=3988 RepID=B9SE24_RICCO|nr:conserved hypothetical protein [Ricinus communis]